MKRKGLWTAEEVKKILCNPVYIGLGSYQAVVSKEQFIEAGIKAISEIGAQQYLSVLIDNLLEAFPPA